MTRNLTSNAPPVVCANCLHVREDKVQPPWVLIAHDNDPYYLFCGWPCAAAYTTEQALLEEGVSA